MIKATQQDYEKLKLEIEKVKNGTFSGFTNMNFIDYSQYLENIRKEFKGCFIRIEQTRTGIRVSRIRRKLWN